ncbi:hypothetical protein GE061_010005 [Apolygus lucorum]|uniref:Uncharacterized protein n=1 Tax=Apolygus lucorum TaxID=248454 RepID=A0A8S9Y242_APOLU|nr:hypothetical protein GE061_010005 [Apolygus lucorum]
MVVHVYFDKTRALGNAFLSACTTYLLNCLLRESRHMQSISSPPCCTPSRGNSATSQEFNHTTTIETTSSITNFPRSFCGFMTLKDSV